MKDINYNIYDLIIFSFWSYVTFQLASLSSAASKYFFYVAFGEHKSKLEHPTALPHLPVTYQFIPFNGINV